MLDIFISSTDEVDLDVLDLVTAFSGLSSEDPPIYEVPSDILYIFLSSSASSVGGLLHWKDSSKHWRSRTSAAQSHRDPYPSPLDVRSHVP